ncbi:hypothetical protein [Prevotella jejuni]|uniref:hypothetical protein n=1 Tax=Prevotella jejuni TaxID=1177574 RepID=UPI00352D4E4B
MRKKNVLYERKHDHRPMQPAGFAHSTTRLQYHFTLSKRNKKSLLHPCSRLSN